MSLLGGAAAVWPLAARAQQPSMPLIGFLHPASPDTQVDRLRAFHQGLKDAALSRARTWPSTIAGPTIKSIGCRRWRPNWFADR
jgi:hypothetical protein